MLSEVVEFLRGKKVLEIADGKAGALIRRHARINCDDPEPGFPASPNGDVIDCAGLPPPLELAAG